MGIKKGSPPPRVTSVSDGVSLACHIWDSKRDSKSNTHHCTLSRWESDHGVSPTH